jgi:hypothetical protein
LTGGVSSLRKHINWYSISLLLLVVYILIDTFRNWDTHRKTYKTKCEEQGIVMYPGVEPAQEPATKGQQNSQITSFIQARPLKWTKEGLLEHIIELVVVKNKV